MLVLNTIFLDLTSSYQVSMEEVTGQQQVAQERLHRGNGDLFGEIAIPRQKL